MISPRTLASFGALFFVAACSAADPAAGPAPATGTAQTPPPGGAAIEAWLADGAYKTWRCEAAIHGARSPSPHGLGRVCANDVLSAAAGSEAPWPVGAAAVEELYLRATDREPAGYAVTVKSDADRAGGDGWYWYARVGGQTKLPHDGAGVVADGLGAGGLARTVCVACHGTAGADADHTPSTGGRDFVFTPAP